MKRVRGVLVSGVVTVALCCGVAVTSEYVVTLHLTRSRGERSTVNLPQSLSVVTAEDIGMSNAKQTTDILGELPGLFIRRTGDFGRADVDIRGIGGNGRQVGVFIDGRPDKMGLFGCAVTHTLPMNDVERIEVIRGPESVLYGSDAFGGMVNIVTRRAQDAYEGNFTASHGTNNTQNYRLAQGGKNGAFDYYFSVDRRTTDGHAENAAYNATDLSGRAGYALSSASSLLVSGKWFTGIKNEPFPSAAGTWNDYGRGSADVTYAYQGAGTEATAKVYRSFGEHVFSDGFRSKDHTDGVMLHGSAMLMADNVVSAGLDYRYQFCDVLNTSPASMIGQYHKYEYAMYVNDEHTFFDRWTLNAGARCSTDEFAGTELTPRLGLVFNSLTGTVVRGIVSRGFRAPQLNDLYLWGGNTDLKPEKVVNYELGVKQSFGEAVTCDVTAFVMDGADMIQVRSGRNQNIGDFEFRGVETQFSASLSEHWYGRMNYTYFDAGSQTTGRPGDKAGASLRYTGGLWKAMAGVSYVGRYYAGDNETNRIDDYLLANCRVEYTVLRGLDVFAAVDNVGDTEYQVYSSGVYTMPKRTVTAGVNYRFGVQ